jgi:hypothetical protein
MRRNERCADSRPSRPHPAGLVGTRGVLNDAISMYFSDANRRAPLLRVGVRRGRVETTGGVFRVQLRKTSQSGGWGGDRTPQRPCWFISADRGMFSPRPNLATQRPT